MREFDEFWTKIDFDELTLMEKLHLAKSKNSTNLPTDKK